MEWFDVNREQVTAGLEFAVESCGSGARALTLCFSELLLTTDKNLRYQRRANRYLTNAGSVVNVWVEGIRIPSAPI